MKKGILLPGLIIILIGINSCKKEYRDSAQSVAIQTSVSSAEILNFFIQNPNVEPAGILLSQAEQETINGKQVVRIPVATNAALYFTKENDSLKIYAYKWVYTQPYTDKYTGKIDIYDFQEQDFKRFSYNNGVLNHITMLRKGPRTSVSGSLKTNDIWTGLAEIWCYITGGTYITQEDINQGAYGVGGSSGANGEVGKPGCDYSRSGSAPSVMYRHCQKIFMWTIPEIFILHLVVAVRVVDQCGGRRLAQAGFLLKTQ